MQPSSNNHDRDLDHGSNNKYRGAQAIDDQEYRYKMPRIIGKVEGCGNGITGGDTTNMVDVASSLHRPPGEVTKFFGCELGAQTTYNDDTESR